ncbi:capsular polysaccharide export protein [Roseovarius nanhaiticus]|uniref:Capsular polysaccharide export protein n=1 Tax=Roseovarius nanhaiticus TaxID=573024 RepID=A0A1N7FM23_9RHOB|nr:capsular polysaccharide biosynthesis protein [Roseovarius nanhaiticus]SEK51307.1 capsular polysaccharide export protein [Roseovarius nanhaiticus]SIS01307.1 capsular polysaccharide export protein [Roseovarius nanhaiticus]
MKPDCGTNPAGAEGRRRVFYFNGGFLRQPRLRRIMQLSGYDMRLGWPSAEDSIAVWGHSPYARRGEAVAKRTGASLIRLEDAWLRSVHPGRGGEPPLGLLIDTHGAHFDPAQPSDLEHLLATHPLDDTALMDRARAAIARLQEAHLSKYNAHDPAAPSPAPGYVLVIDQTRGDAAVRVGAADANTFREMLYYAQEENPGARIVIKSHPETAGGHRAGYFGPDETSDRITLLDDPVSPWHLLDGATAVYTVSSQLGFEAIFAGHRPQVFGRPFYAGWDLTEDRSPLPLARRTRKLSRAQLFAAAMILYPRWYDPFADRLCTLEEVIGTLEAAAREWRDDRFGWRAHGMRLWKRAPLRAVFGRHAAIAFPGKPGDARDMVWAGKAEGAPDGAVRVEDGFLRSRGLGAELVPPLSLVLDTRGIYYDPTRPSDLEQLIARRTSMRPDQIHRAEALMDRITRLGLTKYNLGGARPDLEGLPEGRRILIPGQVEDDASIRTGAGTVHTNLQLLQAARTANPDAVLLYKPHPDVEAGLRAGALPPEAALRLADRVLTRADPAALLHEVDEVWTMTSLLGFEALMRGLTVTTTGAPFYAGWGLTTDLGTIPARRQARPGLPGLVHAALIDYPRYFDPKFGLPCPPEVVLERLSTGAVPHPGRANRLLSKLQGLFASRAALWR